MSDTTFVFAFVISWLSLSGVCAEEIPVNIPQAFQAAQKVRFSNGTSYQRQLFYKDGILRTQSSLDPAAFVLIDTAKQTLTAVLEGKKQYFAVPLQPYGNYDVMMDDTFLYLAPTKGDVVARETLADVPCEKLKLDVNGSLLYLWVDAATRLPKRLESANGSTYIEWEKLSENPKLNAELFSVPAGLNPINVFAQPGK